MATHRAILQKEFSGPLSIERVPSYEAGPNDILIRIEAIALNPGETKRLYQWGVPSYPWIPGGDRSGVVVGVGPGESRFKPGDRVISLEVAATSVLGNRAGGLQDYAIISSDLSGHVPDHYSAAEASTVPVTVLTVLGGFYAFGWPLPLENEEMYEEPVLVWGGGSGVGQAAIALLKLAGYANIITTASSKREEYLKSRGAAHVIDYKNDNVADRIKSLLQGRALKKAFDAISTPESSRAVIPLLAPGSDLMHTLPVENLAKRDDVRSEFVTCGIFHDPSGEHPEHRDYGAKKIWPFIERILQDKSYPIQPQLILHGDADNIVDRVTKGYDLVRKEAADGKKVVIPWLDV